MTDKQHPTRSNDAKYSSAYILVADAMGGC